MKNINLTLLLTLALLACVQSAQAEQEWEFEITPYLWATQLDSEVRVGEYSAGASLEFSDIVDTLEMGLMGQFEARKGRWSVYSDLVYFNLADDQSLTPVTEISSDLKQTVSLVMAGYKPKNLEVLDIYFGVRYDKVEIDLDLNGAIIDRGLSSSVDWIDPVVGVRARYPLNDRWSLESQLFYSAGKADYTVLANAGVRWAFGEKWSSTFSYRFSDIDYDDKRGFKETSQGFMIAFGYRF